MITNASLRLVYNIYTREADLGQGSLGGGAAHLDIENVAADKTGHQSSAKLQGTGDVTCPGEVCQGHPTDCEHLCLPSYLGLAPGPEGRGGLRWLSCNVAPGQGPWVGVPDGARQGCYGPHLPWATTRAR